MFWRCTFWARLSKKRKFWTPTKKEKKITENLNVFCFGPPHLALNPPYFCLFVLFSFFLSFLSDRKKTCFPPRKGIFCLFLSVSLCFSLAFFGLPLFQFLFLCLSLSLSCSFLSFFLLVFLFCFLLVPCFSLRLSFYVFFPFCFMKGTTSKDAIAFFINPLFFVSCLVFSLKSLFFSLFFFLIFSYGLFNINVVGFKNTSWKNTNFWSKGGLQQTVFCL